MTKYRVDVLTAAHRMHSRGNLTLPGAWRMVQRHARRGVKLHGGELTQQNWGMRGGVFADDYRSAVIRVDRQL